MELVNQHYSDYFLVDSSQAKDSEIVRYRSLGSTSPFRKVGYVSETGHCMSG